MTSDVARTCAELIDIESESANESAITDYVKAALPGSYGLVYDYDTVVFALPRRHHDRLVVLAGHTDTVPIDNNFPSRRVGDLIMGRGAADMKAGLAVMLELARTLDGRSPHFDVGFVFFGREELPADQCPLAAALTDTVFDGIDLAVLMEPTDNAIEVGCMGNLNLAVTFAGVSAHSARPWLGENAIAKGIKALGEFVERVPIDVDVDGFIFREVASVTRVNGGTALNVVPHRATFDVNIRYSPASTPAAALAHWTDYFHELGATTESLGSVSSAPVVVDNPLVQVLQRSGVVATRSKQAWTNVADFADRNVAAVNFGPGDPTFAHRQDEQVSIAALNKSIEIMKAFVA